MRTTPHAKPLFRQAALATLAASLLLTACGGGGGGGGNGSTPGTATGACADFDCQGMLSNLANNVIMPLQRNFASASTHLSGAVTAYCAALGSDSEATALAAAQNSWRNTMGTWQAIEVMQIGPLTDNGGALRDTIYSWPVTNRCGVDQDVVQAETQGTAYSIAARTPDRRGLDALEYLLFTPTLNHSCTGTVASLETWNTRPDAERKAVRCQFATLAAADLASQAATLVARWDGTSGNFLVELTQPGTGNSRYASVEAAINALSDALFYVEKQTKDVKLAEPLGLKPNTCGTSQVGCAAAVESPLSANSKANIGNNLIGLQVLYQGNNRNEQPRLGFDDFLDTAGDATTSVGMLTNIANAISATNNIPGSLADAVVNDYNAVSSAHGALKVVTDRLKSDFLTVLGLSIPGSAAGDGD